MARGWNYRFDDDARAALRDYIAARLRQPHFANARSMRNALDRARLRQANRLFDGASGSDRRAGAADADRGRHPRVSACSAPASQLTQGHHTMQLGRPTLQEFLAEHRRCGDADAPQLAALLNDVAAAAIAIAQIDHARRARRLSRRARRAQRARRSARSGSTCWPTRSARALPSAAAASPAWRRRSSTSRYPCREHAASAPYLLVFDPLDGSSNIDVNVAVGTIFSMLRAPRRGRRLRRARLPAARHRAGGRRLRDLRPVDDAGADARPRHARLHARPRAAANSC